jgi:hypothetical protein
VIKEFREEHRFLSNFVPAQVKLQDCAWIFKSVEHAYVAAKTLDNTMRFEISAIPTAGEVKRFGKSLSLRPDWNEVRLGIMEDLVRQKFAQEPYNTLLLETGIQEIVEGNKWHDNFWGACVCSNCGSKGENNLGKILMKIREEIRQPRLFN